MLGGGRYPPVGGVVYPARAVIRLYRAPFSTNVDRVAIALALKGLETESVVISYEDRSPVIEVSGQGLVPVIVDDGEVIADSTRILRHLDELIRGLRDLLKRLARTGPHGEHGPHGPGGPHSGRPFL